MPEGSNIDTGALTALGLAPETGAAETERLKQESLAQLRADLARVIRVAMETEEGEKRALMRTEDGEKPQSRDADIDELCSRFGLTPDVWGAFTPADHVVSSTISTLRALVVSARNERDAARAAVHFAQMREDRLVEEAEHARKVLSDLVARGVIPPPMGATW